MQSGLWDMYRARCDLTQSIFKKNKQNNSNALSEKLPWDSAVAFSILCYFFNKSKGEGQNIAFAQKKKEIKHTHKKWQGAALSAS